MPQFAVNIDQHYMRLALALAARGLGNTAPNPAVGCIIVKDNIIIGRGWTKPGGRPHAETVALEQAGTIVEGATAYVTLEPCAHHGVTPPCANALINAGIKRVIVGVGDSDTRVAGKGVALLKEAGVEVVTGILEAECARANKGFFLKVDNDRPMFTSKLATSIDGKIALANGESKWITSTEARRFGHMLRARHDAILVGVDTVITDNPSLDCRIEGLEDFSPTPIILDTNLRTPLESKLVQNASNDGREVLIITSCDDMNKCARFEDAGVTLIRVSDTRNVAELSGSLSAQGLTRVLIEGGAKVQAAFMKAGFVDEIVEFLAGKILGGDSRSVVDVIDLQTLRNTPRYKLVSNRPIGPDILATWMQEE